MTKDKAFELVFKKVPDYADVMTIEEFTEAVEWGSFNDYDGMGYLAIEIDNEIYEGHKYICCRANWLRLMKNEGWTHVCWYGK